MTVGMKMFLLLSLMSSFISASVKIIDPVKKYQTSFAIIVDDVTFRRCTEAINAYRASVEEDGLSTYIVSGTWSSPSEVREELLKLFTKEKHFEGAVLVGDIPIAMIRNAQHLTSSDKLNTSYTSFFFTSVASDRFYDDFDLKFRYLKSEKDEKLCYYYSLLPDSPQKIQKDIYTARIKYVNDTDEKYDYISKFLLKAVSAKKEYNRLDNALVYTGYGYHSESITSWSDEQLALREEMPGLFERGGRLKKLNFNMRSDIKRYLLGELQNSSLDMAIIHAHGEYDRQQISDYPAVREAAGQIDAAKYFLREELRQAAFDGEPVEKTISALSQKYGIPESWFLSTFDDTLMRNDSVISSQMNITSGEMRNLKPSARFVLLDQCYNGAFQREDYMAGAYLFNEGGVVAAAANSTTVLQDQWTDEYLGLLDFGLRVGQWHMMNNMLESQLFGDPTFHYSASDGGNLREEVATEKNNEQVWQKMSRSGVIALRALGSYKMFMLRKDGTEQLLLSQYRNENSYIMRLQALRFLAAVNGSVFEDVLAESINDPFEFIRRISAVWMGKVGKKEYIPLMAKGILYDESERVVFNLKRSIVLIDPEAAYAECIRLIDQMPESEIVKETMKTAYRGSILNSQKWLNDELLANIKSDKVRLNSKVSDVNNFKIYNFIQAMPVLLNMAADQKQDVRIRVAILETLGYYGFAHNRQLIIKTCDEIIGNSELPQELRDEALRTKKRISEGFNNPVTS